MSGPDAVALTLQAAGVALAPLLVGGVQSVKARLQGRCGAGPLQPYRELRRLWHRSAVDPEGTGPVYRAAPAVVGAALLLCVLVVPVAAYGPGWPAGDDILVVAGLLALARVAMALSAWDTGGGFGLMGASRDLTFAVLGEALLVMTTLVAALPAGTTGLRAMWAANSGPDIWTEPAHWCGALAMGLVVLLETGRQPIDNPDTHLELTMIHEGPLLEYAGRAGITGSGSSSFGLVSRTIGMLAHALDDTRTALELLSAAVEQADSIGAVFEGVSSRRHLAVALRAAGDGDQPARLLEEALTVAEQRGFTRETMLISQLLGA